MVDTATSTTDFRLLIGGAWEAGAAGTYDDRQPGHRGGRRGGARGVGRAGPGGGPRRGARRSPRGRRPTPEERADAAAGRGRPHPRARLPTSCRSSSRRPAAPRRSASRCRCRRPRRASSATRSGALEPTVIPLPPQEMPTTALAPGGLMGAIARRAAGRRRSRASRPYNFPIVNMAGKLGPALAMGNTVVVRPAGAGPARGHRARASCCRTSGFPPGVVNVVTGSTPATRRGARRVAATSTW